MLDASFVAEKKQSNTPLPENMYIVELLDVSSEKRPTYDTRSLPDDQKIYENVLNFQFVLLDGEENGKSLRGRSIWHNFIPAFLYIGKNGKNKLYDVVEALQRQTMSPQQEAEGITGDYLNSLIGKQTRIATENTTKGDKTYSEIVKFYNPTAPLAPLTDKEKEAATPKDKHDDTVANDDFEAITAADVPFPSKS